MSVDGSEIYKRMKNHMPVLKWSKAMDGFDCRELWKAMREQERALLPRDTVFPRPYQIWEAVHDCDIGFCTAIPWPGDHYSKVPLPDGANVTVTGAAPGTFPPGFSPMGTTHLQKGERVQILDGNPLTGDWNPENLTVSMRPMRYDELHENIVPEQLRNWPGYSGYWLEVRIARAITAGKSPGCYLNENFRLISPARL